MPATRLFRSLRSSLRATGHVTLALLISLAFVLVLATLLNYSKFITTYTDIADRRIGLVTQWARDSIEVLLNLGLELKGLQAAPGILEQAKSRYPYIESISLFDGASGRILYSTAAELTGKAAPPAWLDQQSRANAATWNIDGYDPAIAGIRLDSSFLKGVGGIAIVYSTTETHQKIAMMRQRLVLTALAIFAAFALIAVIFALVATRRLRRTLSALGDALDPDVAAGGEGPETRLPTPFRAPTAAFRETAAAAATALMHVDQERDPPGTAESVHPAEEARP